MTKKITLILLFVLFLNLFLFRSFGTAALSLISIGFFLLTLGFYKQSNKSFTYAIPFFLYLSLLCITIIRFANPIIVVVNILVLLFTLSGWLYIQGKEKDKPVITSFSELLFSPIEVGLAYFSSAINVIIQVFQSQLPSDFSQLKTQVRHSHQLSSILIGIIIGLPFIAILLLLLTSADPIFAYRINHLLSFKIDPLLIQRLIISAIFFVILLPLILFKVKRVFQKPIQQITHFPLVNEVTTILLLITILMASYLAIQWPYIFANVPFETDLSKFGVATYSEYVRRGFVELIFVTAILYSLLWTGVISLRNQIQKQSRYLLLLEILLTSELFLFIISIFRRVWLYVDLHGWSLSRLYGLFFLFWLIGMILFLALRIMKRGTFVRYEIIFSIALLAIFSWWNPEHYIALNHPPTVNNQIDYVYLSRLSTDGYTGWKNSFSYAQAILDNQSLMEKPLLNSEDRRQIAYAGTVINQLTRNYHNLVNEYSQANEQALYIKTIIEFQQQALQANLQRIASKTSIDNNDISIRNQNSSELEQLNKMEEKMSRGEKINLNKTISVIHWPMMPFSSTNWQSLSMYGVNTTEVPLVSESPMGQSLNRFFIWDYSKYQAYNHIINEIPLTQLLELQKNYYQFYNKIVSQPDGERDYQIDTSLTSRG